MVPYAPSVSRHMKHYEASLSCRGYDAASRRRRRMASVLAWHLGLQRNATQTRTHRRTGILLVQPQEARRHGNCRRSRSDGVLGSIFNSGSRILIHAVNEIRCAVANVHWRGMRGCGAFTPHLKVVRESACCCAYRGLNTACVPLDPSHHQSVYSLSGVLRNDGR